MSKIINDPRLATCYYLLSKPGTKKSNYSILIPLFLAREAKLRRRNPEIRDVPSC